MTIRHVLRRWYTFLGVGLIAVGVMAGGWQATWYEPHIEGGNNHPRRTVCVPEVQCQHRRIDDELHQLEVTAYWIRCKVPLSLGGRRF
jgi:hypothetical protein